MRRPNQAEGLSSEGTNHQNRAAWVSSRSLCRDPGLAERETVSAGTDRRDLLCVVH